MYQEAKILITGATGSIGKVLVQQLLSFNPAVIRIYSRDEYKQFELERHLGNNEKLRFLLGDVRDMERLTYAMKDIDYIFHLAALKQVPACEYNPFEAIQTNVIGTQNVIKAALENQVKRVLLTSSDKAISPTNTMGASKLIAERLFFAADYYKGSHKTIFSTVRFGNVMGSRGSVVPLFFEQIKRDKKISITHPDMVRFMMSVSEACGLMLQAMSMATGGELFILKMPVVRLGDLAEAIIDIAEERLGVNKQEIHTEVIGLRPGEKMTEELLAPEEALFTTEHAKMFIVSRISDHKSLPSASSPDGFYRADHIGSKKLSVAEIKQLIMEYLTHVTV